MRHCFSLSCLFALIFLIGCPQQQGAKPQGPTDISVSTPQTNPSGTTSSGPLWLQTQQKIIEQLEQNANAFFLRRGKSAHTPLWKAFDSRNYDKKYGKLTHSSLRQLLQLSILVCRACTLRALAKRADGGLSIETKIVGKASKQLGISPFFSQTWPAAKQMADVDAARKKALDANDPYLAAIYDTTGGNAWKQLAAKVPGRSSLFLKERWYLPIHMEKSDERKFRTLAPHHKNSQASVSIPLHFGTCLYGLHSDPKIRKKLGLSSETYNPIEIEIALWFAMASYIKLHGLGLKQSIWNAPFQAASRGNLRGFVLVEILRQHARAKLLDLAKEDLQVGIRYLRQLQVSR